MNDVQEQEMVITIDSDRIYYNTGDAAVFTVMFTDQQGNAIDPDKIKAYYDSNMIELGHDGIGLYTFTTQSLIKANHQIVVNAEKDGYAPDTTYLSIPRTA